MLKEGWPASEVAKIMGVSQRTVFRWKARYRKGKTQNLSPRPIPGLPPQSLLTMVPFPCGRTLRAHRGLKSIERECLTDYRTTVALSRSGESLDAIEKELGWNRPLSERFIRWHQSKVEGSLARLTRCRRSPYYIPYGKILKVLDQHLAQQPGQSLYGGGRHHNHPTVSPYDQERKLQELYALFDLEPPSRTIFEFDEPSGRPRSILEADLSLIF